MCINYIFAVVILLVLKFNLIYYVVNDIYEK